jgi:hypothetical protein
LSLSRGLLAPLLLAGASAAGCSGEESGMPGSERVDSAAQEIILGTADLGGAFNNVAALTEPKAFGKRACSAFLASRRFVVSAAHCFVGDSKDRRNDGYDAVFSLAPTTVERDDPRRFEHTAAVSGPIPTLIGSFDSSNSQHARDIAVIRLDRPVPPSIALPLRPAGIASAPCPSTFTGTLVGFGRTGWDDLDPSQPPMRHHATTAGWERYVVSGAASTFTRDFDIVLSPEMPSLSYGINGVSTVTPVGHSSRRSAIVRAA